MRLEDVENDLPILLFYYDEVLRVLERDGAPKQWKVSRASVLRVFLENRSFVKTSREFGVSPATVNQIVYRAFRIARKLARLKCSGTAGDH